MIYFEKISHRSLCVPLFNFTLQVLEPSTNSPDNKTDIALKLLFCLGWIFLTFSNCVKDFTERSPMDSSTFWT